MFDIVKNENINGSDCSIYKHNCGARLIVIKNSDVNKVFSMAFRTLPKNDCGIPHITEHCVLCGSENYRIKDPFNELAKGSLHTYLNAVTYEDKTIYPVAGINEFDFEKMVRVYIDAVFEPLIFEKKGIFLQEGWNSGENGINGVVLNEMKGVFSSPDRIIKTRVKKELYKNTGYQYYSGGLPSEIIKLDYEQFIDFYNEHYHPSNAVFYLYGDTDTEKYIDIIESYISKSEYRDNKFNGDFKLDECSDVCVQSSLMTDKSCLNAEYSVGRGTDAVLMLAFDIISDVLIGNENGVLRNALLKLGEKVTGGFDSSRYLPNFSITVQNSTENDVNKFKSTVNEVLRAVVKNGLDKAVVEGSKNKVKFYLKEADFGYKPKGLYYNLLILNSVLYNDDSFVNIKFDELFEAIENISLEKLIEEYILDKGCYGIICAGSEKSEDITIAVNNQELEKYQQEKDSEKELAKIPMLNIADIEKKANVIESYAEDRQVLVPLENDDIVYIDFAFDTSMVETEKLGYVGVYSYIVDKLNSDISKEIDKYIGDLSVYFTIYKKNDGFMPAVVVSIKTLKENLEKALSIVKRLLFAEIRDSDKINSLVAEKRSRFYDLLVKSGNSIAVNRGLSYIDNGYHYRECITGLEQYKFLLEEREYTEGVKYVRSKIIAKENLYVAVACGRGLIDRCKKAIDVFCAPLPCENSDRFYIKASNIKNEKIVINSMVNYNAMVGKFEGYSGSMRVLSHIINSDYIWNEIRGVGGAYGGNCILNTECEFKISSYRDPNIEKTYCCYKNLPKYIEKLNLSDTELKKYIIGAINILDSPIKDNTKNDIALRRYFKAIDGLELQKRRDELLATDLKCIKGYAEMLRKLVSENTICSVGGEKDSDLFEEVIRFI